MSHVHAMGDELSIRIVLALRLEQTARRHHYQARPLHEFALHGEDRLGVGAGELRVFVDAVIDHELGVDGLDHVGGGRQKSQHQRFAEFQAAARQVQAGGIEAAIKGACGAVAVKRDHQR